MPVIEAVAAPVRACWWTLLTAESELRTLKLLTPVKLEVPRTKLVVPAP